MYLTKEHIPHYLLNRQLVSCQDINNGDCIVIAKPHRNRNFKVVNKAGQGYFIKQVSTQDAYALSFIKREAGCYQLVGSDKRFKRLTSVMPRLIDYDPARYVLTQELLSNAGNFSETVKAGDTLDPEPGASVGRQLALCHDNVAWQLATLNDIRLFPCNLPWALNFFETGKNPFPSMTPNISAIFTLVTSNSDTVAALRELAGQWRFTSLIHGDIKWDNILVQRTQEETRVKFVDWELVDNGDPAWDLAGYLQNYLFAGVLAQKELIDDTIANLAFPRAFESKEIHEQVQAFWRAYCEANSRLAPEHREGFKQRAIRYAGARLIQSAFEFFPTAQQLPKPVPAFVDIARNILVNPHHSGGIYFGL